MAEKPGRILALDLRVRESIFYSYLRIAFTSLKCLFVILPYGTFKQLFIPPEINISRISFIKLHFLL